MRHITNITFKKEDYGKFLNVEMQDGKARLWVSKHCRSSSYNLEIKKEGHWVLPIEGTKEYEKETNMTTEPTQSEKIPFTYCELCDEAIPDIDEAFYTCSHVNADGYICRQCTITAVRKTYPELESRSRNANEKEPTNKTGE